MTAPTNKAPRHPRTIWLAVGSVAVVLVIFLVVWIVRVTGDEATGASASQSERASTSSAGTSSQTGGTTSPPPTAAGSRSAQPTSARSAGAGSNSGNALSTGSAAGTLTPGAAGATPTTVRSNASTPQGGSEPSNAVPVPPELPPVGPSKTVEAAADEGNVAISLKQVEPVEGQAAVAGEISGPALRFTVGITNETNSPVDLDYVVVNAYAGVDRVPASMIMQPGGKPLAGPLAPGKSATGVYLFSIAAKDRGDVLVGIDYLAGKPTVTFRGDLR